MNKGIVAVVGAVLVLGGAGIVGQLQGDATPGDTGDVQPVESAKEMRVTVLKQACARDPGPEPQIYCAIWTSYLVQVPMDCADIDKVVMEDGGKGISVLDNPDGTRTCKTSQSVEGYAVVPRPDGCSTTETVDVDGRQTPLCYDDGGDHSRCATPAWSAWRVLADAKAAEARACPGGTQPHPGTAGARLCWRDASSAVGPDEAGSVADLPAAARQRVVVCCKGKEAVTTREPSEKPLGKGCFNIGIPVSDFTAGDQETDFVRLMRAACAPCVGWDRCPSCICQPGGCAEACRDLSEPK